jgi:nucleoside-diphosphate-sugar epimerase
LDIGGKYDYILHMASRASPDEYRQHPIETLLANSVGTSRMLELARQLDSRILYASTSEIYGDAQVVPTSEDYWGHVNPVGERSSRL